VKKKQNKRTKNNTKEPKRKKGGKMRLGFQRRTFHKETSESRKKRKRRNPDDVGPARTELKSETEDHMKAKRNANRRRGESFDASPKCGRKQSQLPKAIWSATNSQWAQGTSQPKTTGTNKANEEKKSRELGEGLPASKLQKPGSQMSCRLTFCQNARIWEG